jgi:hypothetical protein
MYQESGVLIELPPGALKYRATILLENTPYNKITPVNDLYVYKSVDINTIKNGGSTITSLEKLARISFFFDYIDFKRASQLNTNLSMGHFRIAYWDDTIQNWKQLPSQVFWNEDKNQGMVEAEIDRSKARYALLWSNRQGEQLSPVSTGGIRIMVNYIPVKAQVAPYIKNGRTMVPLRAIAESLGAQVYWISSEQRIELLQNMNKLQLWIGKSTALKDSQSLLLDVEPEIAGGYTFVPLRFVSEAFGAKVSWDDITKTAKVVSN